MSYRILHIVTNIAHYQNTSQPTGLWLSELTHAWQVFARDGHEQHIASPLGGLSPLEPRSLKWPMADSSAKAWLTDPALMALLSSTTRAEDIDPDAFDAIYFTGGHAVMWDFPHSEALQHLTRNIHEKGGIVAAVCHGYCGLLNTRLTDGSLMVAGRRITGFSWREEILAGVASRMPYNAEAEMKQRGAHYEKAWLPFIPHVVVDGRLVTGQNPMSAKGTAEAVSSLLKAR
ncbi:MAG: type 1 glutamine amidotransferase domain-containing protein [Lautropia sp.]|nr:type 1 glutamine amidotransferase domain-containing protein [Lautropia sp.]